jgi:RNA polymerase sigma factor (sigma-70 family)
MGSGSCPPRLTCYASIDRRVACFGPTDRCIGHQFGIGRCNRSGSSSKSWIKTARIEDNEIETMAARLKSMQTSPLRVVIQHLSADAARGAGALTDAQLLAQFLGSRDDNALAAMVRRHAPMVWGVCGRLLNRHDAEDAFQATFLVLVRKAADVPREAVANWLYGVARQTAVRLRATAAKRRRRETQMMTMPEPTVEEVRDADLRSVLDEELGRLPDHYRGVIVLCDLEGLTRQEAARQLAIPEGSVASRLARARAMLAKRLIRRGVAFSGGPVVAALTAGSASGFAPPALVASTIKTVTLVTAGKAAAAGAISAKVAALTEGVIRAMSITKVRGAVVLGLVACALAVGVTALAPAEPKPESQPDGAKPARPLEAVAVSRFEGHTDGVMVVAFSPDGKRILSGGACYGTGDPTVRLWDVETGKELLKLEGHTVGVYGVAFLPGGKKAISGGGDGTIRIWDLATGKELKRLEGHEGTVYGLDVSSDGKLLLTGGEDKTMRLWNLETGAEVRRFEGHTGKVRAVAFSRDGKQAASGCVIGDNNLRIWDVQTGKEVSKFSLPEAPAQGRRGIPFGGIAPNEYGVPLGGFGPGGFGPFGPFLDHTAGIASVAFSPDGKFVLAGCMDNVVRVWELSNGKERKLEGHTQQVHGAVFTPDSKRILSGSYDQTVRLWDVESGKEVCRFFGHTNWVWGVAVSPDGKFGLSGSLDKTVRLWKLPVAQQPGAKADDGNKNNDDMTAKDGTEKKPDEGKNPKTGGTTGGKPGKEKQKILTPEEAIKEMPKENVTVQFKVASVELSPTYWGYPATEYLYLKDGGKFTAALVLGGFKPIRLDGDKLKKLGINSFKDFEGKMIRVTGQVEPSIDTPFGIFVHDPNNIEVVKE